jgi:hypothetical protein
MRDERLPFFLQEFDEAGFLGDQGVDASSFAVDACSNCFCSSKSGATIKCDDKSSPAMLGSAVFVEYRPNGMVSAL